MEDLIDQLIGEIQSPQSNVWIHSEIPAPPRPQSRSPRVRHRFFRALEVHEVAEECRRTLVELSGESPPEVPHVGTDFSLRRRRLPVAREVSDPAERMQVRLLSLASRVVHARRQHRVATGVRLQELVAKLGSSWASTLHSQEQSNTYVPVEGDRVAEPSLQSEVVHLLEELPSNLVKLYASPSGLFKSEADQILKQQNRCFARFMGDRSEYKKYMARPEVRSLWKLAPVEQAKGRCSFACVPKRSGAELRKILQVCPMNDAMLDVEAVIGKKPNYGLQGGGALAQLSCPGDSLHCATWTRATPSPSSRSRHGGSSIRPGPSR